MTNHAALQALLAARHSCRAFLDDQVSKLVITQILTDAGRAPSWCNAQPWQVAVTSGAGTEAFRQRMLTCFDTTAMKSDIDGPEGYSGAHRDRRVTCGMQLYKAVGVERSDKAGRVTQMRENYRLFGAPHVAVITTAKELGTYGALDCGGYITAFCLSAAAQGIATIPQAAIAYFSDAVRDHFGFGDDRLVLAAISFGYSDTDHPANAFRTDRAPLDQIVDWRD